MAGERTKGIGAPVGALLPVRMVLPSSAPPSLTMPPPEEEELPLRVELVPVGIPPFSFKSFRQ